MDGGIAGELQRVGFTLPPIIGTAGAIREAPDTLIEIHTSFLHAGVNVLRANTSETTPRILKRVGYEYRASALTAKAIELAQIAVQRLDMTVAIAGVIAPLEAREDYTKTPPQDELQAEHNAQAMRIKEAGADAIVCEHMPTIREAMAATVAAAATGLPVFTTLLTGPDNRLISGEDVGSAGRAARDAGADVVLISGGNTLGDSERAGNILAQTGVPWGLLPNLPPRVVREKLLALAKRTFTKGAVVFGGTSNIGPEELRAVADAVGAMAL